MCIRDSLKNAVNGCIVNISIDCTKYISCAFAKYPRSVSKSQSISINDSFCTSVDNIASLLE